MILNQFIEEVQDIRDLLTSLEIQQDTLKNDLMWAELDDKIEVLATAIDAYEQLEQSVARIDFA